MGGASQKLQNTEIAQSNKQDQLSKTLTNESQQLFSTVEPGLSKAENFYSLLASGDPGAIQAEAAPAINSVEQQTNAAREQALATTPAGGGLQEAIANIPISESSQIGNILTEAYASSFPALANLASQGIGQSTSAAGASTGAARTAISGTSDVLNQQVQQKSAELGAIGSVAQMAGSAGIGAAAGGAAGGVGKAAGALSGLAAGG